MLRQCNCSFYLIGNLSLLLQSAPPSPPPFRFFPCDVLVSWLTLPSSVQFTYPLSRYPSIYEKNSKHFAVVKVVGWRREGCNMRGKVWQKKPKHFPNYYFLFCVFVIMTLFLKYLRHQVFGSFALFTDDTKCLRIT